MQKAWYTLIILCISLPALNGQIADWLEDKDYTHVLQSTVDYCFEEPDLYAPSFNDYQNEQFRLKMDPLIVKEYDGWLEDDAWLWTVILEKLKDGSLQAFDTKTDKAIQTREVLDELVMTDTVMACFYVDTTENSVHFVTTYPDFMGWRLYLSWGWNDKLQQLASKMSAIAPIFKAYDDNGENETRNSPIYFKEVRNISSEESLINKPQWAWIGQAKVMLSWEQAEMIKGNSSNSFIQEVLFQKALKEQAFPVYKTESGWWSDQQMTTAEIEQAHCQTDTLMAVNPDTYEVTYSTYTDCVETEDLSQSKLYYRLYFDPKTGSFAYQPLAIQSVVEHFNEAGLFLYYRPLYLLRLY